LRFFIQQLLFHHFFSIFHNFIFYSSLFPYLYYINIGIMGIAHFGYFSF